MTVRNNFIYNSFSRTLNILLLTLLLFGGCGVSFVDSFGMEINDGKKDDDQDQQGQKQTIVSIWDIHRITNVDYDIICYTKGKHQGKKYLQFDYSYEISTSDRFVNFVSKFLYLCGFLELRDFYNEYIFETVFFGKDLNILNPFVKILHIIGPNFFPVKRSKMLSSFPFNINDTFYLGITNLGFDGVVGEIIGVLAFGRVALVWDISSFLNYSKDRVIFTVVGVRPLYLFLAYLINDNQGFLPFWIFGDGKKLTLMNFVLQNETNVTQQNKEEYKYTLGFFFVNYLSCFQILSLEFKIIEHFYLQFYVLNILFEFVINKLFFSGKKKVKIASQEEWNKINPMVLNNKLVYQL